MCPILQKHELAIIGRLGRFVAVLFWLLISAGRPALAQTSSQGRDTDKNTRSSKDRKRNPELESIVDLATGVPPEFGADSLLRLAESGKIADPALKLSFVEKAFYLSESVQQPVKLAAMPGALVDTRSGYIAHAFRLNLDKLSLQSRAVVDVLPLDHAKGEKLFEQIRFPTLKPLSCDEPLIYDPSSYYDALASVLERGVTIRANNERRIMTLLQPAVTQISSHTQVSPVAKTLMSLNLTSEQLVDMTTFFAGSLDQLQGDERSFAVVATKYSAFGALARLVSKLNGAGLPSANLVQVLRQYVIRNLQATRCVDIDPAEKTALPRAAMDFNELFGTALISASLHPITSSDIQNYKLGPAAQFQPYWQTSPAKELLAGIKKLRFGTGETPVPMSERKTNSWNTQLSDFLAELESWKPTSREDAEDFFHEKCVLYMGLIDLIPPGPSQLNVIRSYVTFLELNSIEGTNRIEWYWHVENLLEQLPADRDNKTRMQVLEAFRNSRDLTLNLYEQIDALLSPVAAPRAL
jgi:hypothetical protein